MIDCFMAALAAGMVIGISGTAYMSVDNHYIGALLFCIGLFTICTFNLNLFTGKVGYAEKWREIRNLGTIWLGNLLGTYLCALLITTAIPEIADFSNVLALSRISQTAYKTAILSTLCGILMFIAVETYKRGQLLGILFCVPTFILCGFEHSVADMFYFAAAGRMLEALPHLILVSLCNGLGARCARMVLGKGI